MMNLFAIILWALTAATPLQAGKTGAAQAPANDATGKALMDLENKWVDALAKSDTAALESIFADTYVDTDEQGHRTDKQGVLSTVKSGDLKIESIKLSDMHVHVYGDAAIVTGKGLQKGSFKSQPITATVLFTDTFVKRNGKWKAVASHRSAV
jgi:ketosteroid isomerase-like protein